MNDETIRIMSEVLQTTRYSPSEAQKDQKDTCADSQVVSLRLYLAINDVQVTLMIQNHN